MSPARLRCVIMRGGTSKAVFLREEDLSCDPDERQRVILAVFGSPDSRQINGLGGADPLTSKLAIIGWNEEARQGAHITYTFGQVEIDHPSIDWLSLCGNITAAVGSYAIYEGLVAPCAPVTSVPIFNTNMSRVLTVEVPVEDGLPVERGDYVVPGVPGSGARILVDFSTAAGGATGSLLPTGNATDRLEVDGFGDIEATLIDFANAHVFVRARDVGLTGTETADEIDSDTGLRALLERIRGAGAQRMGLIADASRARYDSPAAPILGLLGPPSDYHSALSGVKVREADADLVSRLMFMQQAHKTYAGTSTVCTGVASRIPGTIAHQMARPNNRREVRIGHPAGVIETECEVTHSEEGWTINRATLGRTARRILEGYVYVPEAYEARPVQ
jgi:methylitaconate Delta-isomerase